MTFDPTTGKLVKLCTGFTLDRLAGNTNGLCGVMAAATVAGEPPSELDVYPIPTVIGRFFDRPVRQLDEVKSFLAPFPETVMIQLTKGILGSDMAALDPDLLSNSFTYCGSIIGPIGKQAYLDQYASQMFEGSEPEFTYFRVDPYDPYRVWVDVRPIGEDAKGKVFVCSPQALSMTFDDNGFCVRMTGDAIMDPSIGTLLRGRNQTCLELLVLFLVVMLAVVMLHHVETHRFDSLVAVCCCCCCCCSCRSSPFLAQQVIAAVLEERKVSITHWEHHRPGSKLVPYRS